MVRVAEQGVERLQFTDRLEEVVVTADTPAAVFHRDAAHHTGRGTFARVGGVVGDAGAYDAREVLALVFLVGARGRVGNVEQGVAVETVANGHRGVLANGMEEADGITDGLLLEVIPLFPDGVAVVAETEIGIVDARVDERQVQIRGLAGHETLQAERVAAAEQVALLDAAAHAELVEGRVAHAAHDGAGAVFLQVDAEIDLIVLVSGNDGGVGLGKVAEAVQALVGAAQLGAVELVPVGKAQFTEDDVVAGTGVALRDHAADMHLLLLVRHIEDVDDAFLIVLRGVHIDFGKGVAVIAVEVGEGLPSSE